MNERIKIVRRQLGLSQADFGSKLGVGKTAISKLENSENNVTDQMVILICREFSVSEEWLRTGEGDMFVNMDSDKELATLFAKFAQSTIVKDDPFAKEMLIKIMQFMTSATEEEWEPIKKFIKGLAATLE